MAGHTLTRTVLETLVAILTKKRCRMDRDLWLVCSGKCRPGERYRYPGQVRPQKKPFFRSSRSRMNSP